MHQDQDWQSAAWITSPHNQYRATLTIPSGFTLDRATAYWAGLGYGVLFVNGIRVAPEEALGPWTTWSKRVLYRCHDVSAALREGENTIGIWLGHGQYSSIWTHAWTPHAPPLGLIFQLIAHGAGGATLRLASSDHWTTRPGPITADDVYTGETFDARLYDATWATPAFNDTGATPAAAWNVSQTLGRIPILSAHTFTPIRNLGTRWPVKLTQPKPGSYLFHFAENFVGKTALHNVTGAAGTSITLYHSEQLALPNGTYCLVDCGGDVPGLVAAYPWGQAQDEYILRGISGGESWGGALFSYHGYQFVQVEGWPADHPPPTLRSISGIIVHSDNRRAADITLLPNSTAGLLNRIDDNIVRSLLSNMHSVESDCPTRERVGWTGDAQATAETAALHLNMASFYTK